MTVQRDAILWRVEELLDAGFPIVPLGKGADGKEPSIKQWQRYRLGPSTVLPQMERSGAAMYGVRLDGLVVLDLDVKDDDLMRRLEARFGQAQVVVETPRGFHLYYRHVGCPLPNLKRTNGMAVDVKAGAGHYVVGPQSIRPDGGTYTDRFGRLGISTLTPFRDAEFHADTSRQDNAAPHGGPLVEPGNRHHFLVGRAVAEVARCSSEEELWRLLLEVRDAKCERLSIGPQN